MKTILLIERDRDIRDFISDYAEQNLAEAYQLQMLRVLAEALPVIHRQAFDAVIVDAVDPTIREVLDFVHDARHHDPHLPIVILVAYADMILNDLMKENLLKEKVSIIDKTKAMKEENLPYLFQSACERGNGEEL